MTMIYLLELIKKYLGEWQSIIKEDGAGLEKKAKHIKSWMQIIQSIEITLKEVRILKINHLSFKTYSTT